MEIKKISTAAVLATFEMQMRIFFSSDDFNLFFYTIASTLSDKRPFGGGRKIILKGLSNNSIRLMMVVAVEIHCEAKENYSQYNLSSNCLFPRSKQMFP